MIGTPGPDVGTPYLLVRPNDTTTSHVRGFLRASQVEAARLRATLRSKDGNGKSSCRDSDIESAVS